MTTGVGWLPVSAGQDGTPLRIMTDEQSRTTVGVSHGTSPEVSAGRQGIRSFRRPDNTQGETEGGCGRSPDRAEEVVYWSYGGTIAWGTTDRRRCGGAAAVECRRRGLVCRNGRTR